MKRKLDQSTSKENKRIQKIQTIKCALKSCCKNNLVVEKIKKDVLEISALAYETSRYIYFDLYEKFYAGDIEEDFDEKKILAYAYGLLDDRKNTPLTIAYDNLRNECGLNRRYDGTQRSNLFVSIINSTYLTMLRNNIWMHAQKRIFKYLLYKYRLTKPQCTVLVHYLFYGSAWIKARLRTSTDYQVLYKNTWEQLLSSDIRGILQLNENFGDWHFKIIEQKPLNFLYTFFKIQIFNEENNCKNFKLIPLFRPGNIHLNYDKYAMYQLLASVNQLPKKLNAKGTREINYTFKDITAEMWTVIFNEYFKLNPNKTFYGSFSTNGIEISLRYTKLVRKASNTTNDPNIDEPVDRYIGIDPGMRLFLCGTTTDGETFQVSSKQYHHDCKNPYKFFDKVNKRLDYRIDNTIGQRIPSTYHQFIKDDLTKMSIVLVKYQKWKMTRKKFNTYIARDKAITSYISKFITKNNTKTAVVFVGDSDHNSQEYIRGYIKSPLKRFIQKLKENKTYVKAVYSIDESYTTKQCSHCNTVMKVSRSPHRYCQCPQCKKTWNRDVNAAINILYRGFQFVDHP